MSHLRQQLLTGDARRIPMAHLYEYCLSRKTSLVWCSGNPLWWRCDTYSIELTRVDSQSQLLPYSHCCPLLYPSQPAGSISSCPQLTLTEVTLFVNPRSGSSVTLGHSAPDNNTCDVISNGISDSRIYSNKWMVRILLESFIFCRYFVLYENTGGGLCPGGLCPVSLIGRPPL